jgi:hypothetical protein
MKILLTVALSVLGIAIVSLIIRYKTRQTQKETDEEKLDRMTW